MINTIQRFCVRTLFDISRCQKCALRTISTPRLVEVGVFDKPKDGGKYDIGQLFLHKIFGYRGVILYPWLAKVYDRELATKTEVRALNDSKVEQTDVKGVKQMYYEVLIDSRDYPHILKRAQTEAVTFLVHRQNRVDLYTIPGLDYVAHEDVLPYTGTDKSPLHHDYCDYFLTYKAGQSPQYIAKDTLHTWHENFHPWLQLNNVQRNTSNNIRVTVIPFYMGRQEKEDKNIYWWRYCIRLENLGTETVQLTERNWSIFCVSGTLETQRGRGVIGQEPVLSPELPAFQYSSHVSLEAPSGQMWGTFKMERRDGTTFDCNIPNFSLESTTDSDPPHGFVVGN